MASLSLPIPELCVEFKAVQPPQQPKQATGLAPTSFALDMTPISPEACLSVTAAPMRRIGLEPVVVKMDQKGQFRVPACTWHLCSEVSGNTEFAPLMTTVSLQLVIPTTQDELNPNAQRYAQRVVTVHMPLQKVLLGEVVYMTNHSEDQGLEFQCRINAANVARDNDGRDSNTMALLKFETNLARTAGHAALDTLENAVKVATEERLARTEAVQAAGNALMGHTAKQAGDSGMVCWTLEGSRGVGLNFHADVQQVNALNAAATQETLPTQLWMCVVAQTGLLAELAQKADAPLVNGRLTPSSTAAAVQKWLGKTADPVIIKKGLHYFQSMVVMGSTYVNDPALETGVCVQSCSKNADGTVNLTLTNAVRMAGKAGEDQTWIGPNVGRAMVTAALNDKLSLEAMDCEDSAQRIMSCVHALRIPSDAELRSTLAQVTPHLPTHLQEHREAYTQLTLGLSAALKRTGEKFSVSDACGQKGLRALKETGADPNVRPDAGSALRAAVEESLAKGVEGQATYLTQSMNAILAAAPQIGAMQAGGCGATADPNMTPDEFQNEWQAGLAKSELSGHAVTAVGEHINLSHVHVGERQVTLSRKVNDFEPTEGTAMAHELGGPNDTSLFSMHSEALSVPATGAINTGAVAQRAQLQKLATVLRGQHISRVMGVNVGSAIMASEMAQKMGEQGVVANVTAQQRFATCADPTGLTQEELSLKNKSCFYKMGINSGADNLLTAGKNTAGKLRVVPGGSFKQKLKGCGTFALSTEMMAKEQNAINKIASVTASHCARLGHLQKILAPVAPLEYQLSRDAQGRVLPSAELGSTASGVAIKALPLYRTREELDLARAHVVKAVEGLENKGFRSQHAIWGNAMLAEVNGKK